MDQNDRDDAMLEERLSGKSSRASAKQRRCSVTEVDAVLDRQLDFEINNEMRLKAIKTDVMRLEALMAPFFERATKDHDVPAGVLCVKILERRALLLGLDSPTRVDVVSVQAQEKPTQHEKIMRAIWAVARPGQPPPNDGELPGPNGSGSGPNQSDGAVDELSNSDGSKPSH